MKILSKTITIKTKKELEFVDITEKIKSFIKKTKIKEGMINICSLHTTASLIVNENEPLLMKDFINNLKKLAPEDTYYHHNDFAKRTVNMCEEGKECKNGQAHCKAMYLPTNVTLNIIKNTLQLGTWQRIFFIELDHARERKIQLQLMGQ